MTGKYQFPGYAKEQERLAAILEKHHCAFVAGPTQIGKSKMLRSMTRLLEYRGAYSGTYFSLLDYRFTSPDDILRTLIEKFCDDLNLSTTMRAHIRQEPSLVDAFLSLPGISNTDIVLIIDELEILPTPWLQQLIQTLINIHEFSEHIGEGRILITLCTATIQTVQRVTQMMRFNQVFDTLLITDMTEAETRQIMRQWLQREDYQITDAGLDRVVHYSQGDYALSRLIFDSCDRLMKQFGYRRVIPRRIDDAVANILNDHNHLPILETLEQNSDLLNNTLDLLKTGRLSAQALPTWENEAPINTLIMSGFINVETRNGKAEYTIKNKLWRKLLKEYLTPERLGLIYSLHGRWHDAIQSFALAISDNQPDMQVNLFSSVVQAIYSSNNLKDGLEYVYLGLRALYPELDISIYRRDGEYLRLHMPTSGDRPKRYALDALQSNEQGIPAAPTDLSERAFVLHHSDEYIGMVVFDQVPDNRQPYGQWRARTRIMNLLSQVNAPLYIKLRYETANKEAQDYAARVRTLNIILTHMLEPGENSRTKLYRLALSAVTSDWGLAFNRAILMMQDSARSRYTVVHAVGQLTEENAHKEWERFPHPSLDAMLTALSIGDAPSTELQVRLANLQIPIHMHEGNRMRAAIRQGNAIVGTTLKHYLPQRLAEVVEPDQSSVLLPLKVDQQIVGMLYVDYKFTRREVKPSDLRLLETFMSQFVGLIERMDRLSHQEIHTDRLKNFINVQRNIGRSITHSITDTLQSVVDYSLDLLGADCTLAFTIPERGTAGDDRSPMVEIVTSSPRQVVEYFTRPRHQRGIGAWIINNGLRRVDDVTTFTADDLPEGVEKLAESTFIRELNIRTFVGVRLGSKADPVGVLYINWYDQRHITDEDVQLISSLADYVASSITNARRYQRLELQVMPEQKNDLLSLIKTVKSNEGLPDLIMSRLKDLHNQNKPEALRLIIKEADGSWTEYICADGGPSNRHMSDLSDADLSVLQLKQDEQIISVEPIPQEQNTNLHRMIAPLRVNGNVVGLIFMETDKTDSTRINQEARLREAVNRLELEIMHVDKENALVQLRRISTKLTSFNDTSKFQQTLKEIVRAAQQATRGVDIITLYYWDTEERRLKLGHMAMGDDVDFDAQMEIEIDPAVQAAWEADEPIYNQNVLLDNEFVRQNGIQASAGFPLKHNNRRAGCMFFNSRYPHKFSENEKTMYQLIAETASLAILNVTLYRRLKIVDKIAQTIARSNEPDEIFQQLLKGVMQTIDRADNICLVQLEDNPQTGGKHLSIDPVSLDFYRGSKDLVDEHGVYRVESYSNKKGIARLAIESGELQRIADVKEQSDYIKAIPSTRSQVAVPIELGQEKRRALVVESDEVNAFDKYDDEMLKSLARHASVAIQRVLTLGDWRRQKAILLIHDFIQPSSLIPDTVDEIVQKVDTQTQATLEKPIQQLKRIGFNTRQIMRSLQYIARDARMNIVPTELKPIIDDAIVSTQHKRPDSVMNVTCMTDTTLCVRADAGWIRHVLENLLRNAFEAFKSVKDGRKGYVKITVSPVPQHGLVEIRMHDNACGIEAKKREKIFELGETHDTANRPLPGFGLYYCRMVVEEHRGTLIVENSEPQRGSCFLMTLPLASQSSL